MSGLGFAAVGGSPRQLGCAPAPAPGTCSRIPDDGRCASHRAQQVNYNAVSGPTSKFMAAAVLPPLPLPVTIAACAPGTSPTPQLDDCLECTEGTYNLQGGTCLTCPKGELAMQSTQGTPADAGASATICIYLADALPTFLSPCCAGASCRGGSDLQSLPNFWRSSNASVAFFVCKRPGVCNAGPAGGNAACSVGQQGPLCSVCWAGYYQFNSVCRQVGCALNSPAVQHGCDCLQFLPLCLQHHYARSILNLVPTPPPPCRKCSGSGQAKAMLAVTVVVFAAVVAALFWRDWEFGHGPGIMTKVKIFLTHFQVIVEPCLHADFLLDKLHWWSGVRLTPSKISTLPAPPPPLQMISLLRDYDVVWPSSTDAAMGWLEVLNVGFTMLAPGGCACGRAGGRVSDQVLHQVAKHRTAVIISDCPSAPPPALLRLQPASSAVALTSTRSTSSRWCCPWCASPPAWPPTSALSWRCAGWTRGARVAPQAPPRAAPSAGWRASSCGPGRTRSGW